MFDEAIDAAAAWTLPQALSQFGKVFDRTGDDDFDIAVFGIADPAAQFEFAGFAMDEPPESDTLHATLNEEMKDHIADLASFSDAHAGTQGGVRGWVEIADYGHSELVCCLRQAQGTAPRG
jgi:hypothetical protein